MDISSKQGSYLPQSNSKKIESSLENDREFFIEETNNIKEDLRKKWEKSYAGSQLFPTKLAGITQSMLDFLLSFENTSFYDSLTKQFNFTIDQRNLLPKIVWEICLKKNFTELENLIRINLQTNQDLTKIISDELNQKIFSKISSLPNQPVQSFSQSIDVKINLSEALKNIPEIGEQLITSDMIKLQNFPEPVRPSIKNWLADYFFVLGNEKHDNMQRGIYLFQSQNGKTLTAEDRFKLDYILKAFDENLQVSVDSQNKIVFPKPENPIRKANSANPQMNIQNASFSSPHQMPFEKSRVQQTGLRDYQEQKKDFANVTINNQPNQKEDSKKLSDFLSTPKPSPISSPQPIKITPPQKIDSSQKPKNINVINLKDLI